VTTQEIKSKRSALENRIKQAELIAAIADLNTELAKLAARKLQEALVIAATK
jgi:hypothetical protein